MNHTKVDYVDVAWELNASKLVGEDRVLEKGTHVPIKHMEYFKPNMDALIIELKAKNRRSDE